VTRRYQQQDSGSVAEVKTGAEFEVALVENPTTGFRWRLVHDPAPICTLVEETLLPGHRPGQQGDRVWRWRADQAGTAQIGLALTRRWRSGAAKEFAMTVRVR
jgi:predicted secreted protein